MTRRLIPAFAVWLLLAAAPAHAVSYGDVEVTVEGVPQGDAYHGYTTYEFVVVNRSRDQSHQVRLRFPQTVVSPRQDYLRSLTRAVTVEPGATVRVPILQPTYLDISGDGVAVAVDGREQEDALLLRFNSYRGGYGPYGYGGYGRGYGGGAPTELLVLVSDAVGSTFRDQVEGMIGAHRAGSSGGMAPHVGGRGTSGRTTSGGGIQIVRAASRVSSWSDRWLTYSRYDGIVVTADEVRAPSPARTALWQYAECGGALVILGQPEKNTLPRSWKGVRLAPPSTLVRYDAGFGTCLVSLDLQGGSNLGALRNAWDQTGKPWKAPRNIATANAEFPVVADIGIPVKTLFVLMIAFVILIGPVNLWALARLKRRIWLLWTAPAISLVTCLTVFGCMLLVEGWRGHLRTDVFTILDHGEKRATTIGWTAFYSPLTPGDGLHFSTATELFPQRAEPWWRGSVTACSIDWTQDQHLTSGWVVARVPAHFMVRKSEIRHERVALKKSGTGYTMTNLLGEDVRQFWFADRAGVLYRANGVAAGKEAALTAEGRNSPATPKPLQTIYQSDWLRELQAVQRYPEVYLAPGTYLAELDGSPFFEDGLRNARTRQCRTLVLGILEAADAR